MKRIVQVARDVWCDANDVIAVNTYYDAKDKRHTRVVFESRPALILDVSMQTVLKALAGDGS